SSAFPSPRSRTQTAPPADTRPATISVTRMTMPAVPDAKDSTTASSAAVSPASSRIQAGDSGQAPAPARGRGWRGIGEHLIGTTAARGPGSCGVRPSVALGYLGLSVRITDPAGQATGKKKKAPVAADRNDTAGGERLPEGSLRRFRKRPGKSKCRPSP